MLFGVHVVEQEMNLKLPVDVNEVHQKTESERKSGHRIGGVCHTLRIWWTISTVD